MLNSILQFQQTTEDFHLRLNDIEKRAKISYPNAAPLLELCQRLYNVRQKFNEITTNIAMIDRAQSDLQEAIEAYYVPSANAVYNACNTSGRMHIDKFAVPQLRVPQLKSSPAKPVQKAEPIEEEKKPPTPRKRKHSETKRNEKVNSYPEYHEITEEEFTEIDRRLRNGINLDIIRTFHKQVYDYFYGREPHTKLMRVEMPKLGFQTKPDICIGVLKILNRITLDRAKNIDSCMN